MAAGPEAKSCEGREDVLKQCDTPELKVLVVTGVKQIISQSWEVVCNTAVTASSVS